jgi:hypothetical protein
VPPSLSCSLLRETRIKTSTLSLLRETRARAASESARLCRLCPTHSYTHRLPDALPSARALVLSQQR